MSIQKGSTVRSKRFNGERSARNFTKSVNGSFKDLRGNENRKSNFKVNYTKANAQNRDMSFEEIEEDPAWSSCDEDNRWGSCDAE